MTGLGNNPFSSNDKVVNDIADIMAKNKETYGNKLPDEISQAAKAAGAEARNSGAKTIETRSSIYNKHLTGVAGDNPISTNSRQEFERIADQEWNTPTE